MAKKIWDLAEPGYQEKKSSDAARRGRWRRPASRSKSGVAEIPTAFTAEFGEGKPVIGILGEFDALPELSQEAVPFRQPREGGNGYGHGVRAPPVRRRVALGGASRSPSRSRRARSRARCGSTCCPAEEGGAAKVFMTRAGLFDDCDAVLHWHPGSRNAAGDALVPGPHRGEVPLPRHAGPRGRVAREGPLGTRRAACSPCTPSSCCASTRPTARGCTTPSRRGGGAANVVPEFAEGFFYVRHPKAEVVQQLYPRLLKCAQAGALATETKLEVVIPRRDDGDCCRTTRSRRLARRT